MTTIIFVILYFIIAGLTAFGCMYYDRVTKGSYDPDVPYFGIGMVWPILLPMFLVIWICMQLKKAMILVIELLMLWRVSMDNRKVIYLDDAINTMRQHSHYDDFDKCVIDEDVAMKALKDLQPAEPERWIPVTKRLPEENEDIIVTYVDEEETRIIPVNYGKGTWYDCIFDTALNPIKVIAWMPLPTPWKGEENE